MKFRLVVAILLSVGLLSLPVLAKDLTVGDFAVKYANALNIRVSTPGDAVRALAEKGLINMDVNLASPLTEGILVELFGKAGISAATSNPASNVSPVAADAAASTLGGSFGTTNDPSESSTTMGGGSEDDANNNGKKTRPKGQMPNSRANPNAFEGREDEG